MIQGALTTTPPGETLGAKVEDNTELLRETLASVRAALSHDLRSPLRAIDGYSRVLRDDYGDRLDEEGIALLERSAAASGRIAGMVDALIGHVRLTQAELHVSRLDISALAVEAADELRISHADVAIEIEPDLEAWGDVSLVLRAMTLALGVACERARAAGRSGDGPPDRSAERSPESSPDQAMVRPVVRFRREAGPRNERVDRFVIEDNGESLDAAAAAHAFEPFAFNSPSSARVCSDLGWGDARLIVQRHGGSISVETRGAGANERTALCFSLPRPI